MIRKRVGDEFWLIAQQDHARLAGVLARAVGNRQFGRPATPEPVYAAVDAHDDGWPLHDDTPTLNAAGLPTDVFETPRAIEHEVWLASAMRATAIEPYAGLLVSLHQLSLSARSAAAALGDRVDDEHRRRQFDLNKIQHALIEHAETLRTRIGLPTDRPLRLGLADGWGSPAEDNLKFDLRLLQAADAMSLLLCGESVPPAVAAQPHPRPGAGQITLRLTSTATGLTVFPWPFEAPTLRVDVPYRALSSLRFGSLEQFRSAYANAPRRSFSVEVRPA